MNTNDTKQRESWGVTHDLAPAELPAVYESPRVVTHSSEKLEQADITVNACTSFCEFF